MSVLSTQALIDIVIDPGHGGKDSGAVGNGLKEKDIVLALGLAIKKRLEANYNARVHMTRTTDVFVELEDRAAFANKLKAKLFVSIHINSAASLARGFETYIYNKTSSQKTKDAQKAITDEIYAKIKPLGSLIHGSSPYKSANYSVLRNTNMAAVLTESAYINTPADAALLKNAKFIEALVQGHVNGIAKAAGLTKKANAVVDNSPKQDAPATEAKYFVQLGAFTNEKNATVVENQAKKAGFEVYTKTDGKLFRVQAGAFGNKANAETLISQLKKAGLNAVINTK